MAKKNGEMDLVRLLMGAGQAKELMSPREMIQNLQEQGYQIVRKDPEAERKHVLKLKAFSSARFEGAKTLKYGVVSDTQFGSQKQQLTFLHATYDRFQKEGISVVLHCGDLVDGDGRVYPGQEFDLFLHGFDRQKDYSIENYPKRPGMETYVIAGNHDWSFWQRKGADILRAIAEKRNDIIYLGPMAAKVVLTPEGRVVHTQKMVPTRVKEDVDDPGGTIFRPKAVDETVFGVKVQLLHMKGGLTYARSYRLQKIIEQMAPEQKPEMLYAGDKHSWAHIPMYRNVYGWQVGCFQAQTEHEKRLGLYPELGGLIIEVDFGSKGADNREPDKPGHEGRVGIVAVRHEQVPFYVPLERDF